MLGWYKGDGRSSICALDADSVGLQRRQNAWQFRAGVVGDNGVSMRNNILTAIFDMSPNEKCIKRGVALSVPALRELLL